MNIDKVIKNENGSSIVIFALILVAMLGFSALVVDVGNVALHKAKTQSIVDAIALAGAQDLPDTTKAAQTAQQYAELNGISPSEIQITFSNSNNLIQINTAENVEYYFAKIFNQQGTTVQSVAKASKSLIGEAFSYTLFSGSASTQLILNGSSMNIEGSCHSNSSFTVNGSYLTITGVAEACKKIMTNGNFISIGKEIESAPFIEMPDFSATIKAQAEEAGTTYSGNKTYNGSNIDVDSGLYVNGTVTINGSRFCGAGCILATSNVTFNGSNLNQTTGDAVCIYSQNGNIIVNGSNVTIDGILYAPNGSVIFNGSNQTINGRVVAKTITINGSGINVIGDSSELNSLPSYGTKLEI